MAIAIKPTDPMLVAIKAEILFGLPELTGKQINAAAMLALIAVKRCAETEDQKLMSGDWTAIAHPDNIT